MLRSLLSPQTTSGQCQVHQRGVCNQLDLPQGFEWTAWPSTLYPTGGAGVVVITALRGKETQRSRLSSQSWQSKGCALASAPPDYHPPCAQCVRGSSPGDGVRMASQALPGFLCELPWEQKAEWTVRERDRERKVFLCRWFTLQWPPRPARCGRRTALIRWQESGARGKTRGKRLPLPADPAPLKATPQPSRPAPPFWQTNGTRHESRGLLSGEKHRADAGSAAMECLEERQVLGAARQGAWCRLGARQCREGAGTVDPAMGWGSGCAGSRRHRPAVSPDPPPPSSPPSPRSPLPSHPTLSLNGCKVRGRRGGGTLVTTSKSARSRTGLGYGGT
nr:uncharacterized protein LOC127483847 isoform X2 [Oryctolagus cuniculus]